MINNASKLTQLPGFHETVTQLHDFLYQFYTRFFSLLPTCAEGLRFLWPAHEGLYWLAASTGHRYRRERLNLMNVKSYAFQSSYDIAFSALQHAQRTYNQDQANTIAGELKFIQQKAKEHGITLKTGVLA
jgi:hypothetical protein